MSVVFEVIPDPSYPFHFSYVSYITNFIAKISENPLELHVKIFPTQIKDKAYIYFSEALHENAQIKVVNLLGETLSYDRINTTHNKKYELNMEHLPPGIYFVKIIIGDKYLTKKIIKL